MNAILKLQYKNHLYKVCKDDVLRKCALDFFENLSKLFEDLSFTPSDFETLLVDGKEVEQDVVKKVFKNKQTASAEEIFLYLFKQNIKKIDYFIEDKHVADNATGFYSFPLQFVGIKTCSPEMFLEPMFFMSQPVLKTPDMTEREYQRLVKQNGNKVKKKKKIYQKQDYERAYNAFFAHVSHVMHHELSHVFEVKTFLNREYVKNNLSNWIYFHYGDDYIACTANKIGIHEKYKTFDKMSRSNDTNKLYPDLIYDDIFYDGATAISEVLNEECSALIDGTLNVKYQSMFMSDEILSKTTQMSPCGYNYNYDIDSLLHLALNELNIKDFRFNSQKVINSINNLDIPARAVCEQKFTELVHSLFLANTDEKFADDFAEQIKLSDNYSLLCLIMGMTNRMCKLNDSDYTSQLASDYKLIAQEMLISAIHTDVIKNFEPTEDYLKNLNDTLTTIDDVIGYPATGTVFHVEDNNRDNKTGEKSIKMPDTEIYSVERFCEKYPNLNHLQDFNELIKYVQNNVSRISKKVKVDEIMSFLEKQKRLNNLFDMYRTADQALKRKKENKVNQIINKDGEFTEEERSIIREYLSGTKLDNSPQV